MSEQVSNLPVSWEDEMAKHAKAVVALERPAFGQISTRGGMMTYAGQMVPNNRLRCVIVASTFERRYYENAFDPEVKAPPTCYALSSTGKNMKPDGAVNPQHTQCDGCPMDKWGTAPARQDGKPSRGKACKETRRLALIPADAVTAGNISQAEVALLSVPVTSIPFWAQYVSGIAAQFNRPPWGMVTDVGIFPGKKAPFEIKFQPVSEIKDDNALGQIFSRIKGIEEVLLTGYDNQGEIDGTYPGQDDGKQKKY